MSSTAWNWLLAIVGTITSVGGLVFSWMAWIQAKGARKAAKEAADAVRARVLSHSFSKWAINAKELLQSVRESDFLNAQRDATDLLGELSHNSGWQKGLESTDPAVEEVLSLLSLVNTYLTDKSVFNDKLTTLVGACQTVYGKMNELAGKIEALAEKQ